MELYAKPLPSRPAPAELYGRDFPPDVIKLRAASELPPRSPQDDVTRLSEGLATTQIKALTLSTQLNVIRPGPISYRTSLTLDYKGSDPFVRVGKGSFVNVTTLYIRHRGQVLNGLNFSEKLDLLFRGLPNLRRLEVDCRALLLAAPIPRNVHTVALQYAEFGIVTTMYWLLRDGSPSKNL